MAATSTSDASIEGPVLSLINKRLRALRKKQNRILQMEESLAQGKSLNKEQQEVLRSKPGLVALIEELEKLRAPLSAAVAEEISLAALRNPAGPPEERQDEPASAAAEQQQQETSESASAEEEHPAVTGGGEEATEKVLEDLLNLLYFGSVFDVTPQSEFTQTMLTRTHERNCCLTYDTVTDDAVDLLQEKDLDLIAALKGLLISRPVDSSLSHKNALQRCVQHAKLWLAKSDQGIDDQGSDVTYAGLREKLSKIISSDYYTTSPEMKRPVEMESFKTIQVPLHGSVMAISLPAQMEGSFLQYQEGKSTSVEEYETNGSHQSASVEEDHKGGQVNDNTEEVSIQIEQSKSQQVEELNSRDMDMEDQQQYNPRRSYQNHRGGAGGRGSNGGRRGNPISRGSRGGSRGGGGYQNGRSQYHDQGGNYYPRNHYRGRGGRGNDYYNNTHSSQMRGMEQHGHAESSVGVASS